MEIINPDDTRENVDINKLDDYLSLQLEKQEEFIKFCKKYGLYVLAFTLDSKSQGGAFYNMPEDSKLKIDFITNMNQKTQQLTNGEFLLVPKKFIEGPSI